MTVPTGLPKARADATTDALSVALRPWVIAQVIQHQNSGWVPHGRQRTLRLERSCRSDHARGGAHAAAKHFSLSFSTQRTGKHQVRKRTRTKRRGRPQVYAQTNNFQPQATQPKRSKTNQQRRNNRSEEQGRRRTRRNREQPRTKRTKRTKENEKNKPRRSRSNSRRNRAPPPCRV